MKKITKIILVMIMIIFISIPCFSSGEIDIKTFKPTYKTSVVSVKFLGGKILGYIINIAAISSVVIIAIMGLKFMVGSVEQKAEYKKHFMPLIVGMFLVLGSSTILNVFWPSGVDECAYGKHNIHKVSFNGKYYIYGCKFCNHICDQYYVCVGGTCNCGYTHTAEGHYEERIDGAFVCQRCQHKSCLDGKHAIVKQYNGKFYYYQCKYCRHTCDYDIICNRGKCECGRDYNDEGHEFTKIDERKI